MKPSRDYLAARVPYSRSLRKTPLEENSTGATVCRGKIASLKAHVTFEARLWIMLAAGILLFPGSVRADYWMTNQPSTQWGTWDGWGCSLSWWANVDAFGTNQLMANLLFSTNYISYQGANVPGLGYRIVRYNLGAESTNYVGTAHMSVTTNLTQWPYRQITGYWTNWYSTDPASSSWSWWFDSNQRNMMWLARDRGANLFELVSYSPMWWMCYNLDPCGADNGANDNLQSWNYDQHAIYLATVAAYAHSNWGVNFSYVEAFNEPSATWWVGTGDQEGCHFATATQTSVIGYLRTELDNRGLTWMGVAASDEYSFTQAQTTWQNFNSTAQSKIAKVNVHGYDRYNNTAKSALYAALGGKKIWQSEYNDNDTNGVTLAYTINADMTYLHPTGWCYWQPYDWSSVGLIEANPLQGIIDRVWPKYYVMAQYSRHIKPGMKIITSGDANTAAAYDSTNHKVVLVTQNWATAQYIGYDLTKFSIANGALTRWQTDTGGTGERYQQHNDLTWNQTKRFWVWFPANSVITIEAQNVYQ